MARKPWGARRATAADYKSAKPLPKIRLLDLWNEIRANSGLTPVTVDQFAAAPFETNGSRKY